MLQVGQDPLMSLSAAAAFAYAKAVGAPCQDLRQLEQAAALIGRHVVIYGREGRGATITRLRPEAVQGAVFEKGAERMRSRAVTYTDLAIRTSDLPTMVALLAREFARRG